MTVTFYQFFSKMIYPKYVSCNYFYCYNTWNVETYAYMYTVVYKLFAIWCQGKLIFCNSILYYFMKLWLASSDIKYREIFENGQWTACENVSAWLLRVYFVQGFCGIMNIWLERGASLNAVLVCVTWEQQWTCRSWYITLKKTFNIYILDTFI